MNKLSLVAVVFSLLCCFGQAARAGAIDIDFWELGTRVLIGSERDREFSLLPQTPFQTTQATSLGNSMATTNYDISWDVNQASFVYDLNHVLEDVPSTMSGSAQTGVTVHFMLD